MMFKWPPPPPQSDPQAESEDDGEFAYALAEFFNLGFDELVALRLAWDGCSPSEARELLKKGCPPDVAAQILL